MNTMAGQYLRDRRPTVVRLLGLDPVKRTVEFEGVLTTTPGQSTFSPPFPIPSNRRILLQFIVDWDSSHESRAGVLVRGFLEAEVSAIEPSLILARITHAENKDEDDDCELMCLDSGKTSRGPCLDCSDGIHTIRVCC
jgi:hypothetical protein